MLYKLLIIDDEEIIRESLVNLVSWGNMGFEVVARLEDGRDAIEYIDRMPVDVVLTDIKMTFTSGLEVAKYIHEHKPDIKVVIISGYKDFEYARQSLTYNVMHYLLKPTSLSEINKLFTNIKDVLDKEREKQAQFEEILPVLREQFFSDLLMGVLRDGEQMTARMKRIGLNVNPFSGFCCIVEISVQNYEGYLESQWEYGKDGLYIALRNFLQGQSVGIQYYPIKNLLAGITIFSVSDAYEDPLLFSNAVNSYFNNIKGSIKTVFDMEVTVKPGQVYESIMALSKTSFESNGNGSPMVSTEQDTISETKVNYPILVEQQKLFMSYISVGNFEAVSNILDSILDKFKPSDIKYIHAFLIDLFSMVSNKLKDIGAVQASTIEGYFDYKKILNINDISELRAWCKAALNDVLASVTDCRTTTEGQLIENAKEYIRSHYNKDISQEDVADHVFISTVYLSRLFKQQTGENFIDYLVRVRMERAVELLKSPQLKTYEISLMVGYKSSKYFSRLFKNFTGFTPSEYRNNILKDSEDTIENDEME